MKNRCLPSLGIFLNFSVFQLHTDSSKLNEAFCVWGKVVDCSGWFLDVFRGHQNVCVPSCKYCNLSVHTVPSWSHENLFICGMGLEEGSSTNWASIEMFLRRVESWRPWREEWITTSSQRSQSSPCYRTSVNWTLLLVFKSKGSVSQSGVICWGDSDPQINISSFQYDLGNMSNVFFLS